jgi:short-subunit dehydrogenase
MKNFNGKTVVITGAASGIGRSLALAFADRGANLVLSDINEEELNETKELALKYSVDVFTKKVDVSKNEEMLALADFVKNTLGNADVMVNNAGVALGKMTIEETSIEEFEWLMGINFWGMVYGTKAFLPQLRAQKQAALVNISSLFGLIGIKFQGAYCSSKFGIRGFNEALMAEMMDTNVQIHSVHPGGIKTNIARRARGGDSSFNKVFDEKFLKKSPDEAAQDIIRGIEKNQKRIIIGRDAKGGDIVSRLKPITLINFLQKHFHKELN